MKKKAVRKPLTVEELAERYRAGRVCLEYVVLYYLQHCRPQPLSVPLVKALQKAIECASQGWWDAIVSLDGGERTVRQVVQEYGLGAFVAPQVNQEK